MVHCDTLWDRRQATLPYSYKPDGIHWGTLLQSGIIASVRFTRTTP